MLLAMMKTLVEPIMAQLSFTPGDDGPTDESEKYLAELTANITSPHQLAETAAEVAAKVLNSSGVVEEYHTPRLVVHES